MVGHTVLGPRHEVELLHLVPGRVTPLQGKGERARSLKYLIFSGIHDFASSASRQRDHTALEQPHSSILLAARGLKTTKEKKEVAAASVSLPYHQTVT